MLLKTALLSMVIFALYWLFSSVWKDIQRQIKQETAKQLQKINNCRTQYYINKCQLETRVPALEAFCNEQELCMNTEIEANVKIISQTFNLVGLYLDNFTTELTYTSLGIVCLLIVLFFKYFLKYLFGSLRRTSSRKSEPQTVTIKFDQGNSNRSQSPTKKIEESDPRHSLSPTKKKLKAIAENRNKDRIKLLPQVKSPASDESDNKEKEQ